jgi:hypothetical protein
MTLLSTTYRGSPVWSIALTIAVPIVIAYLALTSTTRLIRAALLPLALYGLWVMSGTYVIKIRE